MARRLIEVPPGQSILIGVGFFSEYYNQVRVLDSRGEVVQTEITPPDSEPIEINLIWNNNRGDATSYPYKDWRSPKNTSDDVETYYIHVRHKDVGWNDPREPSAPLLESEEKVLRNRPAPRQRIELGYNDSGGDEDFNDVLVGVTWLSDSLLRETYTPEK